MTTKDEISTLQLSISELRRMHDEICQAYSGIRVKAITFLGGEFAFLSYLYSGGTLFIPPQIYGIIFYFIGLFFCISALVLLFLVMQPVKWRIPTETKVHKNYATNFSSFLDALKYVQQEYIAGIHINIPHCEKKQVRLNLALIFILVGVSILVVIKSTLNLKGGI